jgi:ribosomal protein S18 acetylase RimI-like enzyme
MATENDIPMIVRIYDKILDLEAAGKTHTGWRKGIYPTEETAMDAISKNELFVLEEEGRILASARINQEQVPEYANCQWTYDAPESEIMVIHTLVVDPDLSGQGLGSKFIRFYESFALNNGCRYLRLDTNAINVAARALYKKLGYTEQGIVSCVFNGIEGAKLVCLEKKL